MRFAPKRILVLDDKADTCQSMRTMLELWNYEVAIAMTVTAVTELTQSENFDLYLVDVGLPDI